MPGPDDDDGIAEAYRRLYAPAPRKRQVIYVAVVADAFAMREELLAALRKLGYAPVVIALPVEVP